MKVFKMLLVIGIALISKTVVFSILKNLIPNTVLTIHTDELNV